MKIKSIFPYMIFVIVFIGYEGCSVLQTFQNIARLKFKLDSVNNFLLSGINISNKSRLEDFTATEILQISTAVARKDLPVSFTLYVDAKNPVDTTGGHARTNISLKSFPWTLLIDDKETVSGNISSPIIVPGAGEEVKFPLTIELDLFNFFENRSYQDLINLALRLGGQKGQPTNIKLTAQPTVSSSFGDFTYPDRLVIVSQEFR